MSAALLQECHAYLRAYQKHCSPSHPVRTLLANIDAHLAKPSCEAIPPYPNPYMPGTHTAEVYEEGWTAAWAAAREYFQREELK